MRQRADVVLAARKLARSRSAAADLINAGSVSAGGSIVKKPSELIEPEADIAISENAYVGRGGKKLEGALDAFGFDPAGMIAVDIGSSTGGFTECLLRRGAKKVYAVDVGTDQFAAELRADPRIVLMEQTDIRSVAALPEPADLAVIDVSFISIREVLPSARKLVKADGAIIALIKPQFETANDSKNKSGIVKNALLQKKAIQSVKSWCSENGFWLLNEAASPILGGKGNAEYFFLLKPAPEKAA